MPDNGARGWFTHDSRSVSVPILLGSKPPSNTTKGVTPKWRSRRIRCMAYLTSE